jgi:hypothetical protein
VTAPALMSEARFWALVEASRARAGTAPERHERQASALTELLAALPADEIAAFDERWAALDRLLDRRPLVWAAIHAIEHGCDAGSYWAFKAWLIGRGRAAFEQVVEDADALGLIIAREDEDEPYAADLATASDAAYEHLTGTALAGTPDFRRWTTDEWMRRLPRIWSVWGWCAGQEPESDDDELEDDLDVEAAFDDAIAAMPMVVPGLTEVVAEMVPTFDHDGLVALAQAAQDLREAVDAELARRAPDA